MPPPSFFCPVVASRPGLPAVAMSHQNSSSVSLFVIRAEVIILNTREWRERCLHSTQNQSPPTRTSTSRRTPSNRNIFTPTSICCFTENFKGSVQSFSGESANISRRHHGGQEEPEDQTRWQTYTPFRTRRRTTRVFVVFRRSKIWSLNNLWRSSRDLLPCSEGGGDGFLKSSFSWSMFVFKVSDLSVSIKFGPSNTDSSHRVFRSLPICLGTPFSLCGSMVILYPWLQSAGPWGAFGGLTRTQLLKRICWQGSMFSSSKEAPDQVHWVRRKQMGQQHHPPFFAHAARRYPGKAFFLF